MTAKGKGSRQQSALWEASDWCKRLLDCSPVLDSEEELRGLRIGASDSLDRLPARDRDDAIRMVAERLAREAGQPAQQIAQRIKAKLAGSRR